MYCQLHSIILTSKTKEWVGGGREGGRFKMKKKKGREWRMTLIMMKLKIMIV